MFFLFFFTSFLSSEYLMSILLRANLLMFLGANNISSSPSLANNNVSLEQTTDSLYNGTYYYESSDNFDRYLQELGVGYFLRNCQNCVLWYSKDD